MIGLGIVGLIYGDFAGYGSSCPPSARPPSDGVRIATLMLVCGIGLLFKRTEALAARVLFPYWALLVLPLKIPVVVKHPLVEVTWQSMSEIVVVMTGAWVLFAADDKRALRIAQLVFGLALIPLGLAHFVYLNLTAPLVPAWLPFHTGWAYFTGAAQIAAGVGVLVGIYPQLAASLDAALLTAFTFLVWIPLILAPPASRPTWSEFTASWRSAGAWAVAASIANEKPAPAHGPR